MRGAVAALGLVLAGWPVAGLAQTAIAPDVGGRGLGTTVTAAGTTYAIDGGTRAGNNLFHSFDRFSVGAGDTAQWVRGAGDGAQISNVINRVTGGQVSSISGTLDSTALPNASFYFINPAGIVFGAGAKVNVPAAAYFSTASQLRFADGSRFALTTPSGSVLSVAAPESFGFVGGQGAIDIQDVGLAFTSGSTALSFTASDINVVNARFAAGGLDMVAVGDGAASVRLTDPLAGAYTGDMRLANSTLSAGAIDIRGGPFRLGAGSIDLEATGVVTDTAGTAPGADLVFKADRIHLGADSFVITSSRGSGAGGQVLITAHDLDADATGGTTTTGFTSVATAGGAAGSVQLTADHLRLAGGAFIGSTVSGDGDAGDVSLSATDLVLDNAVISSATFAGGDGGEIHIRADTLDFGAAIIVTGGFGAGAAGDVFVDGRTLDISGGFIGSTPGGAGDSGDVFITLTGRLYALAGNLGASSFSANNAGVITVRAPEVVMEQSTIATSASANGSPGRVLFETGRLVFDQVNMLGSSKDGGGDGMIQLRSTGDVFMRGVNIFSNALGLANGGVVSIEGKDVEMVNTIITSDTFSVGAAGKIDIRADTLHLDNTQVTSTTDGEGQGGAVSVFGRKVTLDNASTLSSDTVFMAKAGSVTVTATETLDVLGPLTAITSQAKSGTGDGGSVTINAGRLFMSDASISSDALSLGRAGSIAVKADQIVLDGRDREFTYISSDSLSQGEAGSVTIDAKSLTLRNRAYVSSSGFTGGDAGDITIRTGDLSIMRGGFVTSIGIQTNGGDISIVADKVSVTSETGFLSLISSAAAGGKAGNLSLDVGTLLLDAAAISSDTLGEGDAGNLRIKAGSITLKNLAAISSSTDNFGNAGALSIDAKTITLETGSQVLSAATSRSEGDARSITIKADAITVGQDAAITTATFGRGDAGKVDITAGSLRVDGGEVSSSAGVGSAGAAGDVSIVTGDLTVVNAGIVSTLSANANKAGQVRITAAGQVTVDGLRSIISSENLADDRGDAGEIFLTAKGLRIANGAGISTNSVAGAAGNIDIRVARPGLVVLEGAEFPGLILTSSGPGKGGMITLADPLAIISNGGRILALGQQRGANVVIQSKYFINSTDRRNVVDVAGDFRLETGLYDVSSGTVTRDISVLDASKVLRGQCPAARSTGVVSQLITRPVGPYVREPDPTPAGPVVLPPPTTVGGDCR